MSKAIKKITLSLECVDQVIGYLSSKPYVEVFQLMNLVQSEARASLEPKPTKKSGETPEVDKTNL